MKEIVEYQILREHFNIHCGLGKTVDNAIRNGWQLYGELQMCEDDLCQPMVKYGEKELQGDIKYYYVVTLYTRCSCLYEEFTQNFSKRVNELIQMGYQPYGSLKMSISNRLGSRNGSPTCYLAQAMVIYR